MLLACLLSTSIHADPDTGTVSENNNERPKIGLVLSGGGARGFAHIGVLKKIEELQIPIDIVVGTSMGSIIGGLYAIGLTPDEIEQGVKSIDWELVFNDFARREYRSFRRKQDDYLFTSQNRLGISSEGVNLPPGLIEGQQIELALDRLAYPGFHITDFDKLHIPYRAIATDIETGDAVILDSGNLAKAMRASMSIPAALPPVKHDGKLLVDGGIGNNIPIDVARDMGAEIFIVVDVSAPLAGQEDLQSSIGVTAQLTTILTRRVADQLLESLTADDVLIVPGRDDLGSSSFLEYTALIQAGLDAAEEHTQQLNKLSLPAAQYQAYRAALPVVARHQPVIDFIEVQNQTRLDDGIIQMIISQKIGQPLDVEQLERDLQIIYGLDLPSSVVYSLETVDDKTGLIVYVRDRPWAPSYLKLGLTLRSEFDVGSVTNVDMIYTNPSINRMGGEFRVGAAFGSEPHLVFSLYQPLDKALKYFVAGDGGYTSYLFPGTNSNNEVEQLFRFQRTFAEIAAGRIFRQNTELRVSLRRATGDTETLVGLTPPGDSSFDEGFINLRLLHDSLDHVDFPRSGYRSTLQWRANRESLGADLDYDQIQLSLSGAGKWGRHTVYGRGIAETTVDENAPVNALFRRGGLFELSGFLNRQLAGQHFGLLEAIYYHRIGNITLLPIYAGFSVEAGNAWNNRDEIKLDNTVLAGSVFLGADTILGPVYLAYGINDSNASTLYLYIGRQWNPH
ncbi:MAG: patatin-like phospholipase family protein [Thiotrichales bacterium]|nr:MAG: patatin-like phospholipase family protein [Thiotrichales bacterium]